MTGEPRWQVEGRAWPHRAASRFVEAGGLVWHVQQMGAGPVIVLLHGTGAATHSWRGLMPLLARSHTVIAPDLPGHGFTRGRPPGGLTLPGMAGAVARLLAELAVTPTAIVGHSAGAAIALQWAHDGAARTPVVGLNPALTPYPGLAARLFPALALMLFVNPLVPRMLAGIARLPGETGRFLERATGSTLDRAGVEAYQAVMGTPGHCAGTIEMMARWNLEALARVLPAVTAPVLLVHSHGDRTVPLASVEQAAALLPSHRLEVLPGLGHLAHEERPDLAAALIRNHAATPGGPMP